MLDMFLCKASRHCQVATRLLRSFSTNVAPATRVNVHEVAPRDGLQNEKKVLSTAAKLDLVQHLIAAKPQSIEVTSFVRADLMPPLADADELCKQLWQHEWAEEARKAGMQFAGLVLNQRGFERFARAQLDTASVIISCTESHSKANNNKGFDEQLELTCAMIRTGKAEGYTMRGYASVAFGCPFEGETDPLRVQAAIHAMADAGADVILLGDTIGVGYPHQVRSFADAALRAGLPVTKLGLHMHDTYGRGSACVAEGLAMGMEHMDAAVGGCGGCPFAPGAAGNLATEDLVRVLNAAGVTHSIDSEELHVANQNLEASLERKLKVSSGSQSEEVSAVGICV